MKPTVSLTPKTLVVTEGETFTWNFSLDKPAPVGGLSLFLPITVNNDPAPGDVEYFIEGSSNISDFKFVTDNDEPISQIYAFGDSYSDDGLSFEISTDAVNAGVTDAFILPADPELGLYDSEGRWTNGPTAVEVLSENLEVDLTDYAVGGAKSGDGNYYSWLDSFQNTGVFGQIDQFSTELSEQTADSDALYFIFVSANDFFEYSDFALPGTVEELAVQTVENIVQGVSELSALGAEQFLVVNSSDLSILPGVIEFEQAQEAALFTQEVNNLLPQELEALDEQLDVEIALYDHVAISDEIRSNPQEYGLTNIDDPYQPVFPIEPPANSSPDQYYFWDEYHPTRRVHQIIGEDMANFIDFADEDDVSVGFELTIAGGETEATLVSSAIADDVKEIDEIFTTIIADGEKYHVNPEQNQVTTIILDSSTDLPIIKGTANNDVLPGTHNTEVIKGGKGDDTIYGNGGNDNLIGGNGNDRIFGASGAEVIKGGKGDDTIYGNGGNDNLIGGDGNDYIFGASGAEVIKGGKGDDIIYANGGDDFISSGSGFDTVYLGTGKATVVLGTGEGFDTVYNFQLGATKFEVSRLDNLNFSDSMNGAQIFSEDDLLAVVVGQSANTLTSNQDMIFAV